MKVLLNVAVIDFCNTRLFKGKWYDLASLVLAFDHQHQLIIFDERHLKTRRGDIQFGYPPLLPSVISILTMLAIGLSSKRFILVLGLFSTYLIFLANFLDNKFYKYWY